MKHFQRPVFGALLLALIASWPVFGQAPGVPTGLAAAAQGNGIRLTWNNGSGLTPTDYQIERGEKPGGPFNLLQTIAYSRTPTFTDNGVVGGIQYCYQVRARTGSITSPYASAVCATANLTPTNVTNLQAQATGSRSIRLSWTPFGKESGIDIERRTGQTGGWSKITSTLGDYGQYTDNDLATNTEYCYRIIESGHDYSNTVCATTQQTAPEPPARLSVNAVSSSQINLQWADVSNNETGFQIERADNPTGGFSKIADLGVNSTTFSDQGLAASRQYCYRVRAINGVGASVFTEPQCATTQAPPVGAPQNLTATATSTTQISLSWAGVAGATRYELERSPNGTDNWQKVAEPAGNATTHTDPNLTPNTRYYYRIRAVVSGTTGPPSNVANALTPDVPPVAPNLLTVIAVSYQQIDLSWADLSGNESNFQVDRSPNGTDGWEKIAEVGANTTSYSDQSVQPQTRYFYRIRATNAAGPSVNSNVRDATTPVGPPATPQNLTATAVSTTQINLSWNTVPTATSIVIERSPNGSGDWNKIGSVAGNATTYSDQNLTRNTRYYYRIQASNASGTGPFSKVADAQTPDVPPTTPSQLKANAVSPNHIDLSWTDLATNESGFELERAPSATGDFKKIADLPTNTTAYQDKNLADNTQYCYRIRTINAAGPSAFTDAVCARTPLAPPPAPTNLTAQLFDYDQIRLNWDALGTSAVTVIIERSTNPNSDFKEIKQQPAAQIGYVDGGLQEYTTYYYRIQAVNAAGKSTYSNVASARVDEIVIGVEDEFITFTTLAVQDRKLIVRTSWQKPAEASIQLLNLNGQIMAMERRRVASEDNWQYDLTTRPAGIYLFRIVAEGRVFAKRFLLP
ncbi:fibronectin type III domain-containing protein [Larkinella rosea]|nr:fibronectin type III domain-containing protein [Larkinella rosea]